MSDIKSSLDKIKNIPKDPMIYHTKGTFFEKIGKIDNAIKEYKTAAEYDYAKSQYALANIYYDKKKYSEAEEWYSRAYKNGIIDAAIDIGNMYFNVEAYEKEDEVNTTLVSGKVQFQYDSERGKNEWICCLVRRLPIILYQGRFLFHGRLFCRIFLGKRVRLYFIKLLLKKRYVC